MSGENNSKKRSRAPRRAQPKQAAAETAARQAAAEAQPAEEAMQAEIAARMAALKEKAALIPDSMLPRSVPEEERPKLKMLLAAFPPAAPGQIFVLPPLLSLAYIFTGCFILWTQGLNQYIIPSNISQVGAYFHTSTTETLWLVSAYMAPYASFTILLTKIRTQIGVRRFTIISLVCFAFASLLHAHITDYKSVFLLRFFSGLTGAPLSSVALLYIMTPFAPLKKMTSAISISMFNIALGTPFASMFGAYIFQFGNFSTFCRFELGLSCLALALIKYLPAMPMPKMNVLEKWDFISYPLLAAGLGLSAAILPVGRYYWWLDAPWIGGLLAVAAICLCLSALIELNRRKPLIDLRWLFSREMIQATLIMITFRVLVTDQSSLLKTYYSLAGLDNTNLIALYAFISAGTIAGGLLCAFFLSPGREDYFYFAGMAAIALGSYLDSYSTALTRPPQMYLTQTLIGLGVGLFMPTALSRGIYLALMRGSEYIVSFVAVFLFTQCIGGLSSSAFFGTLQQILEKFHSSILTAHLVLSDSQVAQRLAMLAAPYRAQLTDPNETQGAALAALARQTAQQANILAFNDVYRIYFYIALVILALLAARISIREYRRFPAKDGYGSLFKILAKNF